MYIDTYTRTWDHMHPESDDAPSAGQTFASAYDADGREWDAFHRLLDKLDLDREYLSSYQKDGREWDIWVLVKVRRDD